MANLNCSKCGEWLAEIDDTSWRLRRKSPSAGVSESLVTSSDLWSELEVVERRADEWRVRGVYDPMPPPPEPGNTAVTMTCGCGESTRFERP